MGKRHGLKGQQPLAQGNALGIWQSHYARPERAEAPSQNIPIMAQSLCKIYLHVIFHIKTSSVKMRETDLERIHHYIGALINETGCQTLRVGGIEDHIHALLLLSRDTTISHLVEEMKRNSSRWIKTLSPGYSTFAWQGGYAVLSVSQSVVDKTLAYIENQSEHHKTHSFHDEYVEFLKLYNIQYNEEYIWQD